MTVRLIYDSKLAEYRFMRPHPMRPERFTLAVALMREWGLTRARDGAADDAADMVLPCPASVEELQLGHSLAYIEYVRKASQEPGAATEFGLGGGDTPAFIGMHDAASLAVGATLTALRSVLDVEVTRAFNPAGGLHHAQRDRASGFCVYNDAVIAIEDATQRHEGLKVAYVDVDAHHGDGVEAAFVERSDVLTISVHESGRYLFPGTGRATDTGHGAGAGATINVPLPPYSGAECFAAAFEGVIAPAVTAFAPDVLVIQGGADSHVGDPLTHLAQTVSGYADLIGSLTALADHTTSGRLVLLGGGGYLPFDAVPRMWAAALAVLLERAVPATLPDEWLHAAEEAARAAGGRAPASSGTFDETDDGPDAEQAEAALQITRTVIREVRDSSPLLR